MNSIKECFKVILEGDKEEGRAAARRVRKILYGSHGSNIYNDIKNQVYKAELDYGKITETWRQENFVVAISVIYYLHDKDSRADFLFSWLYKLLLHSNGVIRYAAVRMFDTELGPLTVHIRFPDEKFTYKKIDPNINDSIIYDLYMRLNQSLNSLSKPAYKRYKYVSSLPRGAYKSVQMVISRLIELCGDEYIYRLDSRHNTAN